MTDTTLSIPQRYTPLRPTTVGASDSQLVDLSIRPRRHNPFRSVPRGVRRLSGPLLLLLAWQVATSTGLVGSDTLAPPSDVWAAGQDLFRSGELQTHLWASLQRVGYGLSIGISVGLALAMLAGFSKVGEDVLDSGLQVLRSIPVLAPTPLLILWFGIGEQPKVAMVAIGTTFPIYLNTYAAVRGVDAKLAETASTFGVRRWSFVRHVIFPGALPGFLVGLRYSMTVSWLLLVISEQINATSGIGYLMNDARSQFRTDIIVLGIVIYAILGLLSDAIVRFLERHLLTWRRGFSGS